MERKEHVIDTTMVESEGVYYRISKDETNKCLLLESCDSLTGNFQEIPSETLSSLFGVEGPEDMVSDCGSVCGGKRISSSFNG